MDITNPDDLQIEVTSRAYRDLQQYAPEIANNMEPLERSAFEAGVAAGCKATLELLEEQGNDAN